MSIEASKVTKSYVCMLVKAYRDTTLLFGESVLYVCLIDRHFNRHNVLTGLLLVSEPCLGSH